MLCNSILFIEEIASKKGHLKEKHKYGYVCIPTYSNKVSCVCLN